MTEDVNIAERVVESESIGVENFLIMRQRVINSECVSVAAGIGGDPLRSRRSRGNPSPRIVQSAVDDSSSRGPGKGIVLVVPT